MSAWIVSEEHVNVLVHVALYGPDGGENDWGWDRREFVFYHQGTRHEFDLNSADSLGVVLWHECHLSVNYRYEGKTQTPAYQYHRPQRVPTVVETLKQIDCYSYQSCEHPGWEGSAAHSAMQALTAKLIGCLPGYDAAPWGWDKD